MVAAINVKIAAGRVGVVSYDLPFHTFDVEMIFVVTSSYS
jgi:hypothetical protein